MQQIKEIFSQVGETHRYYFNSKGVQRHLYKPLTGTSVRIFDNNTKKMAAVDEIGDTVENSLFDILSNYNKCGKLVKNTNKTFKLLNTISPKYIGLFKDISQFISHLSDDFSFSLEKIFTKRKINNYLIGIREKYTENTFCEIKFYYKGYPYKILGDINNIEILLEELQDLIYILLYNKNNTYIPNINKKYNIVLAPGQPHILIHECCGHLLEGSKNNSPLINLTTRSKFNDELNIIDSNFNMISKEKFDDEGIVKNKLDLIKNGQINDYLLDINSYLSNKYILNKVNCLRNCRRQSFEFYPEPRMFSTYIKNGSSSPNKIINNIETGIYIKRLGDSYVNNTSGDFISKIECGYIIYNGKIKDFINGYYIKGNSLEFLNNINMIGNDFKISQGFCNSQSGRLYVEYGGPTISINNMKLYKEDIKL